MKYFVVFMGMLFLTVIIFYEYIIAFLGPAYRDHPDGFEIVSILLIANLFLGVLFNLSIWYKLTKKTIFGAYISIFGALITLTLNVILIPKIGIIGSAWTTLFCYFSMTILSYFLAKKHFPVPYQTRRLTFYFGAIIALYFVVVYANLNIIINVLFLIGFAIFVYLFEKKQKLNYESENY